MPTVDILGVPHAYELTASTPKPYTLVFIHGWLLSRQYWQPLIQQLAPEYQCLAYDLRGFGNSVLPTWSPRAAQLQGLGSETGSMALLEQPGRILERRSEPPLSVNPPLPQSDYTPAAFAQDLNHLLAHLNISKAWLIGHSLGGTIALWGADQLSFVVKGVVCVNAGGGIYLKEEFERFRAAGEKILRFRPAWLATLPWIDWLFSRASVAQPVAQSWGRQRVVDFVNAYREAALGALLESTTEAEVHRLPQMIARLQQPVYFIAGMQDPIMEPKYVRHLASFHPLFKSSQGNVIEVPNCGHMAMIEQPDAIASHIKTILADHSGPAQQD